VDTGCTKMFKEDVTGIQIIDRSHTVYVTQSYTYVYQNSRFLDMISTNKNHNGTVAGVTHFQSVMIATLAKTSPCSI